MGKINIEWHKVNKMPKSPSTKERLEWHIEHSKHCDCRKPTEKLLQEIREYEASK